MRGTLPAGFTGAFADERGVAGDPDGDATAGVDADCAGVVFAETVLGAVGGVLAAGVATLVAVAVAAAAAVAGTAAGADTVA